MMLENLPILAQHGDGADALAACNQPSALAAGFALRCRLNPPFTRR